MTRAEVETEVELSGVVPDSPLFPIRVRARLVEECLRRQSVHACANCKFFDNCELAKQHGIDEKYELPRLRASGTLKAPENPWLKLGGS